MTTPSPSPPVNRADFEQLIATIRPELHRYATRMTGSVIDGEDVVQEALIKAYSSLSLLTSDANLRGWLFRITHNKAIDHLRRYRQEPLELLDETPLVMPTEMPLEEKELAAVALSLFLKLAPRQRSCVILKDVLDYSLAEISELLNATVPEIKATLHRGRVRLRQLAGSIEEQPLTLNDDEREQLAHYVDRFNARDFDAVRDMLAAEVRLDLVGQTKLHGATQVNNNYFYNYKQSDDWHLALGTVEGRPAILVYDPHTAPTHPLYFMLVSWQGTHVSSIRDYRYARHVLQDAVIVTMG